VHGGQLTAKGVRALLTSDSMSIEELGLSQAWRVKLGPLMKGPAKTFSKLRALHYAAASSSIRPIVTCTHLTQLRELVFDEITKVTNDDLEALLDNAALGQLERLTFGGVIMDPTDGDLLARLRDRIGDGLDYRGPT
jgi:hypothetical protein